MPSLERYERGLSYSYALGLFPAMACLQARPDLCLRLLVSSRLEASESTAALREGAEKAGIRIEEADRVLARLSQKENVFAAMVFRKEEAVLSAEAPHVVLHQPGDAGNIGSILRSCAGLGVSDIAVIRPAVDAFEPHAVRATMGALFRVRLRYYEAYVAYRAEFPAHAVYPFMLDGSVALSQVQVQEPWSLVFGNEARGLPPSFAAEGQPVRIEQTDAVDSLNLSVAAALGIYSFLRKG